MSGTIKQILKGGPITIRDDDSLALALQVMIWSDVRHLPVLKDDVLVGLLSERDVLRRYAEVGRHSGAREKARAAMSRPPITIRPDEDVSAAIKLVTERGIGCVPVVERGRLVGMVTRRDLLAQGIEESAEAAPGERVAATAAGWTQLLVDDVMSREPITAAPGDTIWVAIDRMSRQGVRHLPVVDVDRRAIGMLSDRDLRTEIGDPMRALDAPEAIAHIESTRVSDAMTKTPITLPSGTRLSRAAFLFADHKVGAVPIVDEGGRLVGLVSYSDVLRAVLGPKPNLS